MDTIEIIRPKGNKKVNEVKYYRNFQVQLEPTASWALTKNDYPSRPKYNGLFRTTKDIFREEGLPVSLHVFLLNNIRYFLMLDHILLMQ